jgi:hypothetical protein
MNFDAYFDLASICRNQKENAKSCEVINKAIVFGSQIAEELNQMFCK